MYHFIRRAVLAVLVTGFSCACGSNASNQQITEPESSAQDTATPTANTSTENAPTHAPSSAAATDATSVGDPTPPSNTNAGTTDCDGRQCENGQSCIEYYGFAGKPLYICGIACTQGAPNDGCPDTMKCVVMPDGPTQCMPR